jgi:hypothetical protein
LDRETGILIGRIVFGLMGIFGVWEYIRLRIGKNKKLFLMRYRGDRWRRGTSYGLPFVGTAFLVIAFVSELAVILPGRFVSFLFMGLIITAIIAAFWQPDWLKPNWWRWIEQNHADIIPLLQKDIHPVPGGRDPRKWDEWVNTQQGLEEWVEEVRRKHGLE